MHELSQTGAPVLPVDVRIYATTAWDKAWGDVQSLRPIIEAHRQEAEDLRRLPDAVAGAFLERDIYRLMLPEDLGGAGISPLQHFDLIVEVARSDASAGWLYWLAGGALIIAGKAPPEVTAMVFASADCGQAAALAPTGRAVAVDGGYRVSGRWAWASGIHNTPYVGANCLVFDGDAPRLGPHGGPTVLMAILPKANVRVLDTWRTGGMRGTGSTEFEVDDQLVPDAWAFPFIGGEPVRPDPVFKLPPTFFAFGIGAVAIGVASSTIEALKTLALAKKLPPPRGRLADEASLQFTLAKTQAMVEAVEASLRQAISRAWEDVCTTGQLAMENRLRFRRALAHAVDTCIEAVGLCYRAAGGSAVHQSEPFERAMRDVHTIGAHMAVQRGIMEQAGAVALGVASASPMF
jgi:alkylation response protein AidB-like acyl-CoA dehydrogenase